MRKLAILAAAAALIHIYPSAAAELAPYEGTASSKLLQYHGPGQIDGWQDTTRFRFSRDCQKYTSEVVATVHFAVNGVQSEIKTVSKSLEALDGHRLEFEAIVMTNGQSVAHKKGSATLQGKGRGGVATFRMPSAQQIELPAGTLFPDAAQREAVDLAAKGKKHWKQLVFEDGELIDYSYTVLDHAPGAAVSPTGDPELLAGRSWTFEMLETSRETHKSIKTIMRAHANGIVSQFVQYSELFDMSAGLKEIRTLPSPQC